MIPFLKKCFHLILSDVGVKILNFIVILYLARIGNAQSLGWVILGTHFLKYTTQLSNLGWNTQGILQIAQGQSLSSSHQLYISKLIWSLPVTLGMGALIWISQGDPQVQALCLWYLLVHFFDVLFPEWYLKATQKFHWIQVVRTSSQFLYLAGVLYLVQSVDDFILIPQILLASMALVLPLGIAFSIKEGFSPWALGSWKDYWTQHPLQSFQQDLKSSMQIGLSQICLALPITLPPILLGVFATYEITGQFGLALRLLLALMLLDQIVHIFLLSGLQAKQNEVQSYLKLCIWTSGVISITAWVFQWIPFSQLLLYLGKDFQASEPHLKTLAYFIGLTVVHSFIQSWLYHTKSTQEALQISWKAALLPLLILTYTILYNPLMIAESIVFSEFILVSVLTWYCFRRQAKALWVWYFLIGLAPMMVQQRFGIDELGFYVMFGLWLLICYFHPMMIPLKDAKGLLRRWNKLNK